MNFYIWFYIWFMCSIVTTLSVWLFNTSKGVPYTDKINNAGFIVFLVVSTIPGVNIVMAAALFIVAVVVKVAGYISNCKTKPFCGKD